MYSYIRVKKERYLLMNNRFYVIDGSLEFNRREFEDFLIEQIHENELYDLRGLLGDGAYGVELHVRHHPLRLAREIFGEDRVVTYTK
jgi:hypothetical protein